MEENIFCLSKSLFFDEKFTFVHGIPSVCYIQKLFLSHTLILIMTSQIR